MIQNILIYVYRMDVSIFQHTLCSGTKKMCIVQMLTGLCGAGSRLSHCLGTLVQDTSSPCHAVATQCQATWEELVKATTNVSTVVKAQVIPSLQEMNTANETDTDCQKVHEHTQVLICTV